MDTTFVHDYIDLFAAGAASEWDMCSPALWPCERPTSFVEATALVLNDASPSGIKEADSGTDTSIGMVAWRIILKTLEYPEGRPLIVIANDITHINGSFGTKEDALYARTSALAREMRVPRVYLAANSGARIGLAEEVKAALNVAWNNPDDPAKGFQYLYLNESQYQKLSATNSIIAERVEYQLPNGTKEIRYPLETVIGSQDDLGVECLKGSGLIAGETSRAYNEIVTITYTTVRTVGIGSYVLRLGQRAIMHEKSSIILTGYNALNKLLGSEVYNSNQQLGGPRIMCNNGISHLSSTDDKSGIQAVVHWLRYVPINRGAPLPRLPTSDSVDRDIDYVPTRSPYPASFLVAGCQAPDGSWQKGFFDTGSFTETLGSWAKTVVTGRGTLGGIPMGVILVETRTEDKVIPADPALPDTQEVLRSQAGQVWFPDSSYKTAQALEDFNREGLPAMIFANWRGFSGGQSDMYNEVLKYGSFIVDALVGYKQPVFVYIPPKGELRGGSWVVVDPSINPDVMEMFADADSRGGVLEPEGIVEIKYRTQDLLRTMHRLDGPLMKLDAQLKADEDLSDDKRRQIQADIKEREKSLLPFYHGVAVHFADLHDKPGRMLAKNVISDIVTWKRCRSFFYWRLRRRLTEFSILDKMQAIKPDETRQACKQRLASWLSELPSDQAAVEELTTEPPQLRAWAEEAKVHNLLRTLGTFSDSGDADLGTAMKTISQWVMKLSKAQKTEISQELQSLASELQQD